MPEEPWLAAKEIARREGVTRETVWRWVDKGLIEVRRRGPKTGVRMRFRSALEVKQRTRTKQNQYGELTD